MLLSPAQLTKTGLPAYPQYAGFYAGVTQR